MSNFQVSVIIPVYNAEKFLEKSVRSAASLDEVGEVILIEDKSPDNCLELCEMLQDKIDKVVLYQHPDKENHGGSASRNLGIKLAKCDYIAFLDADDYYLSNRFLKDERIFTHDSSIDGVYNALGIHYYTEKGKQNFLKAGYGYQELTTVNKPIPPEELFYVLINAHSTYKGEFHTNTITLRKEVFERVGAFNDKLAMQEDPHLWRRLAAFCKLVSGEIVEPVAIRGVHDENRMVNMEHQKTCRYEMWHDLKMVLRSNQFQKTDKDKYYAFNRVYHKELINNSPRRIALSHLIMLGWHYPDMVWKNHYFFDSHFLRLLGRNWFTLRIISFKNKFAS